MERTIFKQGDRVYCYKHGWGIIKVVYQEDDSFMVLFENGDTEEYTSIGVEVLATMQAKNTKSTLSFTEYTLEGFSLERPIDLPEVGEEVFYSLDDETWYLAEFKEYKNGDIILKTTFRTGMPNIFECNNIKRIR